MNKQVIILVALFAMVACAFAQYDNYYQQPEEKKFFSIPALKLKLNLDKLTFKLPNLGNLFQKETHHYQTYQPSYQPSYQSY